MKRIAMFLLLLCPVLAQAKKKFNRGIMKSVFAPKGQWSMSSIVSCSGQNAGQYQFLVLANIDAKGYIFRSSPPREYFFTDNMAVGSRFTYSRAYLNIGSVDTDLGDDLSFHIKGDVYLEHNHSASGFLRACVGLGSSKAFDSSSEVCLTYVCRQGKHSSGTGNDLAGCCQCSRTFEIGVAPGLTAFISDSVSVEVPVGVVKFSYKWADQIYSQTNKASRHGASGNFRIDLSSINFGVTMYF